MSRQILIFETTTTVTKTTRRITMQIEETELDFIRSTATTYKIDFETAKRLYKLAQNVNEFYEMCEEEAATEAD